MNIYDLGMLDSPTSKFNDISCFLDYIMAVWDHLSVKLTLVWNILGQ